MNLSERLKKARENASLSQQDVADSLNISRQSGKEEYRILILKI